MGKLNERKVRVCFSVPTLLFQPTLVQLISLLNMFSVVLTRKLLSTRPHYYLLFISLCCVPHHCPEILALLLFSQDCHIVLDRLLFMHAQGIFPHLLLCSTETGGNWQWSQKLHASFCQGPLFVLFVSCPLSPSPSL